uniref:BZIP domain-containing protein n=1 Tax=Chenopodium quinoa TaxID=63459 RepID=A0A803L815_CHEQI
MGAAEEQTPSKPSKATSSAQETQAAVPSYPDWSGPMQAYYGNGATPPFFASTVAAPAPHPYMWAGQHPMMPPYGTPVPYPALYPPGGVYAHPNMAMTPNPAVALETEGKNLDVKDQNSAKKSKGNSGMGNEKAVETGKATSGSGNEGASQSAESGSEGSSDGSDDNNQQACLYWLLCCAVDLVFRLNLASSSVQENSATKKGSFDLMLEDGANAQNSSGNAAQGSVPGKPVVAATNLNIGMDLWNTSAAGGVKLRPNTGVASAVAPAMVGREGLMPDHQWIQDERELKRQKRKQSNRESARRSRLRKQAECEELQRRVESLNNENSSLREELKRLSAECEKLTSENNSIKEELTQTRGPDSLQSLGENNASGEADS